MKLKSLRTKTIFWTSLCSILMGCAIILYAAISVRNASIENTRDQQTFLARDRADHVLITLERKMDELRSLALILEKIKDPVQPLVLDRNEVDIMLQSVLKRDKNIIGVYTCWQPDAFDGRDKYYKNEPGHDKSGRFSPYWYRNKYGIIDVMPLKDYTKTMQGKYFSPDCEIPQELITEPRVHTIEGKEYLVVSFIVPIVLKEHFYGIIGIDSALKSFQGLTDETGMEKKEGCIAIISPGGKILASTGRRYPAGEDVSKFIHGFRQNNKQFGRKEPFLLQYQDYIYFFNPVKPAGSGTWWITAAVPQNMITAESSKLTRQLILVGTACILVSILIVWILATRITKPLIQLRKHVHLIGHGKYDYTEGIKDIGNSDEIGELARAFNKMVTKIKLRERERDDAEKTLQLYEQIVSTITDMMSFMDVNYRYRAVNDAYLAFFPEKLKEDIIGCTPADLIGEEEFLRKIKPRLDQCLKGDIVNYQASFDFPGKGIRDLNITYYPVFKDGMSLGIIHISRDITSLRQSEKALRESEARAHLILDTMPSGLYTVGPDKKITYWNKHAEKITGLLSDEVIGKNCVEVFGDNECQRSCCLFDNKVKKPIHGKECRIHYAEGKNMLISKNMDLLKDTEGKTIGGLESFVDITRTRRLEAQLLQSHKMEAIGTLAGGIAHDFNNILFPLLGYSEMLKEDLPTDSPLQGHVDEILHAALRSKNLVKQILTFSRQADQELRPIKLQPIVKEVIKLLRSSIPTTIDIQQDIDPECDAVIADPTQVHQIIMNLATNAYHAMEDSGGRLGVSLKQFNLEPDQSFLPELPAGEYTLLTVADTGIGIEKDIMNKIFDPYFTTKETGKGTGLGLSVVLGIVKTCNGDIRIYSEPGEGTEIQVYLPVITRKAEDEISDLSEPIQGGTEKILLIDDEEPVIRMEQKMLERLGYRVTIRTGSLDGLEAFKANPDYFDLVITDMTMPNMTGIQLAGEIKKIRSDIPVVLCTGFSYQINGEKSKALGIQGFVMKPVVTREMAQTIRKVLDNLEK